MPVFMQAEIVFAAHMLENKLIYYICRCMCVCVEINKTCKKTNKNMGSCIRHLGPHIVNALLLISHGAGRTSSPAAQ